MTGKEKKVETRDILYEQIAQDLLGRGEVENVERYKEGLKYEVDGETHIIRVIKKKNEPEAAEMIGSYSVDENSIFSFSPKKSQ